MRKMVADWMLEVKSLPFSPIFQRSWDSWDDCLGNVQPIHGNANCFGVSGAGYASYEGQISEKKE